MIAEKLKQVIRDIPDFPKKGIIFKDITPILKDPALCREITANISAQYEQHPPDAIAAIESRGFFFGMLLAEKFSVPFIPIRKKGKLPYDTVMHTYDLEYGRAEIEIHTDAIQKGWQVMIHDDLLATGGTASAAAELIKKLNGNIHSFTFVVALDFLDGKSHLSSYTKEIYSLANYQ